MGLLLKISLRNLLRQKRRNFFLGLAIAVGMMILVATSSFTKGLTDVILNKWLVYSYGHVSITGYESGNRQNTIVRDRERIIKLIKSVKGVKEVNNYLGIFTRVVGNGKSTMMALVGMPDKDAIDYLGNTEDRGNAHDFTNRSIENPVIMGKDKAKDLNVKVGDTLRVRLTTVNGQVQSADLSLVATSKELTGGSAIAFYIPIDKLKDIRGLKPYESGPLQVVLNHMDDPQAALVAANKIHELLKPGLAGYYGDINSGGYAIKAAALTFYTNSNSMNIISSNLPAVQGSWTLATNTNSAAISVSAAEKLHLGIGSSITGIYPDKFGGSTTNIYKIGAIFKPGKDMAKDLVMAGENNFYYNYLRNLPADSLEVSNAFTGSSKSILAQAIGTEWKLLPRTYTSDELQKKLRKAMKEGFEGSYYDVSTMYEAASFLIDLQRGLDMISLIAVMILFFVILIGVLNTLRMTIRERTREIGTIRAIGMQKDDVKISFIMETFFLTLAGCIAGIILSIGLISLLSLFTIETDSMFGMLLVNKHVNFVFTPGKPFIILFLVFVFIAEYLIIKYDEYIKHWLVTLLLVIFVLIGFLLSGIGGNGILTFLILILNMLMAIAYFPARRAAALSAAAALRQYE
jgi:ABC-type lipoprotein release transport system permease subunit